MGSLEKHGEAVIVKGPKGSYWALKDDELLAKVKAGVISPELLRDLKRHARLLAHSFKQLAEWANLSILRGEDDFLRDLEMPFDVEKAILYLEYALSHLETGYPELYKLHEEGRELEGEYIVLEAELLTKLSDELKRLPFAGKVPIDLADIIMRGIKRKLLGYEPRWVEDELQKIEKGLRDEIRRSVFKIIADKCDVPEWRRIGSLMRKFSEAFEKFSREIKGEVIAKIDHGLPLEGRCRICQKLIELGGAKQV